MVNMPKKWRPNDIDINIDIFILESPIIARPISSGNGDATINAPTKGTIHLNTLSWKIKTSLFCLVFWISQWMSSDKLFLINLKISRFPMSAPILPNNATSQIELAVAILKSIIPPNVTVNVETNNIPAIKLPNILISWVLVSMLVNILVFARIIATTMLTIIIPKSRIVLFFLFFIFVILKITRLVFAFGSWFRYIIIWID